MAPFSLKRAACLKRGGERFAHTRSIDGTLQATASTSRLECGTQTFATWRLRRGACGVAIAAWRLRRDTCGTTLRDICGAACK